MKINYTIKNYKEFLRLDELNKEVRKLCSSDEILNLGLSEEKNKIIGAKLGNGKENALIFGAPHANEPIGCLTCLELIKIIKLNKNLQKKYTWYIIPCSDPDGIKLNESWFKGKFSIEKYVRGYYRSPPILQSEWSFPVKYKKYRFEKNPKHNEALKKLIDKIKPKINYPLHNAGFSGAFFLLSHKMPKEYYAKILNYAKN
jgi:murein tripeptide amidase MpaA